MGKHYTLLLSLFTVLAIGRGFCQEGLKLEAPVNSPLFTTREAALSLDGRTLAFISEQDGSKLMLCNRDAAGNWTLPDPVNAINNFGQVKSFISSPCFNYNASVLYFAANYQGETGNTDIYFSEKKQGIWSEPVPLPGAVNTPANEAGISVSSDGQTIYFTREYSNLESKVQPCKKMFTARKNQSGLWDEATELPKPLNLECEESPKIGADNKTLFFASTRTSTDDNGQLLSKGGYDIYYAVMLADKVWSIPVPATWANTEFDDYFPTLDAQGNTMIVSRSGKERKGAVYSLYSLDIPTNMQPSALFNLKGRITDQNTGKPIKGQIQVSDANTSVLYARFDNNPTTGEYDFFLPGKRTYKLEALAEAYSYRYALKDLRNLARDSAEVLNFQLYNSVALQLNVFDNEILAPLKATITVTDSESNQAISANTSTSQTGRYIIRLPLGKIYTLTISAQNYEQSQFELNLKSLVQFDLFERDIELVPQKRDVVIKVSDEETSEGFDVELVVTNLSRNEKIVKRATKDKDGNYVIQLREGDKYQIDITGKGYAFYNAEIDLGSQADISTMEVSMKPLSKLTTLNLKNITYETNSAALNAGSFEELNRVLKLMQDNPGISIEISAHTDNVGSDIYNQRLSDKRAQSVVDYLAENGIDLKRMIAKGYGEKSPIAPNDTDENKALNRRVELKILEIVPTNE